MSLCPMARIINFLIAILLLLLHALTTDVKASLATDDNFSHLQAYLAIDCKHE